MPELAEVEFFRKRWHLAAAGRRITSVALHRGAKVFRGTDPRLIEETLPGTRFETSEAAAKQMLFRFSGGHWLGIHLGMSGDLDTKLPDYTPQKHDHLVLTTAKQSLVFSDPRMFGRVQFHVGKEPPPWWTKIAPAILSSEFNAATVSAFLTRRKKASLKAVMLMQEQFPGIGNWMADEILWRAGLHPKRLAGSLIPTEVKILVRQCRTVCRQALAKIAGKGDELPDDLNVNIPETWLFRHRWREGGRCPKTNVRLIREDVGGRTTCWSPARQPSPESLLRARSGGAATRARRKIGGGRHR
ncbi:MAG: DNA-formamidopyrimidine glycosylase family protein [Opitutus sp.]